MAAVMKYSGMEISLVNKHTRTVGFFPVPEVTTNIHVVCTLVVELWSKHIHEKYTHNACTFLIVRGSGSMEISPFNRLLRRQAKRPTSVV